MKSENFFLTAGTSEAMSFILKVITNPKSEVLLPTPGYPLYDFILNLENCESRNYLLYPQKSENPNKLIWKIDFQSLEESININTKAIVIVEPHNPTGARITIEDVAKLILIAKNKNLILIIDEVFSDYYEDYYRINPYLGANCIYLNGLSKTLALPQMKLSWIYLDGDLDFVAQMKDALEIVSDTYLSVNIPVQLGLEKLLETSSNIQKQIQSRIKTNSLKISQLLETNNSIEYFLPDGGWCMILNIINFQGDEKFAYHLLKEKGLYVYPGYMFDMPDGCYIVISLILHSEMIEKGIKRIIEFVNETNQSKPTGN
jgi:aspartate/methionine/tyrosine aminotransferase